MQDRLRTFIALEIPVDVQALAKKAAAQLQTVQGDVQWVDEHRYHFTLKFLGDVPTTELHEVSRALSKAVATIEPFDVEIHGMGAFPEIERSRTIWLGVREGAEGMENLASTIDAAFEKIGYRKEPRRFHPHLTLGRVRRIEGSCDRLAAKIRELADYDAGVMYVEELTIFSSTLSRQGPKYEPIGHAELLG